MTQPDHLCPDSRSLDSMQEEYKAEELLLPEDAEVERVNLVPT